MIPLAIATVAFRRRAEVLYDLSRERIAIVNADFQESLSGVRESQAFVHEELTKKRFHGLGDSYLESRVAAQRLVATYFPFVQFLSGVADAIVLGLGAVLITQGNLTAGALIAFILYIDMFFSPIQQLSQVFDAWQQTRVSVARIADLMELDTLTPEAAHPVDPGRISGELSLTGVRFSYPTQPTSPSRGKRLGPADVRLLETADAAFTKPPEALRGIDLHIAAGETVALVGETGAGKSTVMKLVARFYDADEGAVTVDGLDVRDLDLHGFRTQLGYVPQEAFLFTGSVRDNIAYGRPEASDAEVEAAARAVGAHEFVVELDGGYLHELSERGRSLSAGHRQLLALARAELVESGHPAARRGHLEPRPRHGGTRRGGSSARIDGSHDPRHRAPAADGAHRRPHRRAARRPAGRDRKPRRAARARRTLRRDVGGLRGDRPLTRPTPADPPDPS